MRSVYIITGGILAVIAVVFLTQNSKNGANDSVQQAETNSQEPQNERWRHPEVVALEKTEMRKYGRILTPDERSEQWWREQDEAEERAAYAQLYEERKEWIDNFPFRRGYHPDIVYDPENNIAHSTEKFYAYQKELEKKADDAFETYEAKTEELWARTDLTPEEKHAEDERLFRAVELADEAIQNPDPEIMAERRVIMRHKRLAGFYEQNYRYLPEFEQAYRIFEEEGAGDNPVQIADTMASLEMYKEASKHDPEELHQYFEGPMEGKEGNHPYTNQQFLDRAFHWIVNTIADEYNFLPGETPTSREQAERIAKRLVEEIPADGFTGQTFLFGLMDPKDEDMVPGQSLLAE